MFTSIFAAIFLGESFGGLDFIAAFLCLVGVTLCSKPSFLIESGIPTLLEVVSGSTWSRAAGSGAALTGAVLSALAYVTVRKLGRSVHFLLHVTYFGMASSIFSLTMAYSQNQLVPVRFDKGGLVLVFIGLSACVGQCLLNSGLQLAPAGPGTLMRNLDVAFAFFYGITIFNEIPDFYSISGAILIVGCAVIMGLRKYFASRS
jgi:drug/metabolite transporter (DMT)-like permease